MNIDSKELRLMITEEKKLPLMNPDYSNGFLSALSNVEGMIAELEEKGRNNKCGNCKWLGKRTHRFYRSCTNPKKKFRTPTAHLKYNSTIACKLFEETDGWGE